MIRLEDIEFMRGQRKQTHGDGGEDAWGCVLEEVFVPVEIDYRRTL